MLRNQIRNCRRCFGCCVVAVRRPCRECQPNKHVCSTCAINTHSEIACPRCVGFGTEPEIVPSIQIMSAWELAEHGRCQTRSAALQTTNLGHLWIRQGYIELLLEKGRALQIGCIADDITRAEICAKNVLRLSLSAQSGGPQVAVPSRCWDRPGFSHGESRERLRYGISSVRERILRPLFTATNDTRMPE